MQRQYACGRGRCMQRHVCTRMHVSMRRHACRDRRMQRNIQAWARVSTGWAVPSAPRLGSHLILSHPIRSNPILSYPIITADGRRERAWPIPARSRCRTGQRTTRCTGRSPHVPLASRQVRSSESLHWIAADHRVSSLPLLARG